MLLAITPFFFIQCDSEDDLVTENAKEGGLFEALNPSLNYVVGDGKAYSFSFQVYQSPYIKATSVDVYKSCYKVPVAWSNPDDTLHTTTDSIPGMWSNEVLQETITITNTESHVITTIALNYAALIENLTIGENNDPLPAVDSDMRIGDFFNFRVVTKLDDGRTIEQSVEPSLTVSTRFAGTYKVIDGVYYRLGVDQGPMWEAEEIIVSSVDAKTYVIKEWGILSGWGPYTLYFQIDAATSKITYPAEWDGVAQVLNDYAVTNPIDNPADLSYVIPFAGTDINSAIKDDVEGKDRLNMVYGYYTTGSGPREFYFLMEKVVN